MKESDVQTKFGQWVTENYSKHNAAWELKLSKGNNALPFSSFEPQQLPSLLKVKTVGKYRKLSDADRSLKPFDCFMVYGEAYVVACWHHEGEGVTAYWIDIDDFMEVERLSERKSLTEFIAVKIATRTIHL